jgi:methylenetetrahydrofolate dehydrogenase (NADP+)/methenyltetrahydrofolate cyclohydrolase
MARIIDGKATAAAVRAEVRATTELLIAATGVKPGLAVVLVGADPASEVYVRHKDKDANEAGFDVRTVKLPATCSQTKLMGIVRELNEDASVHGLLVQLPLPEGLDKEAVIDALDPAKDVDGLHPINVAALTMGRPGLVPCTPAGCIELCDRYDVELEGARVVVVGRSLLVGKPFATLALARNATVTVAHSRTRDLAAVCREADIVLAAVGRPKMIQGDWIREGAAVIDVGINRTEEGKLVGDVDFQAAEARAGAITPVPGGVGPMTRAMLLMNTLTAAARQTGNESILQDALRTVRETTRAGA